MLKKHELNFLQSVKARIWLWFFAVCKSWTKHPSSFVTRNKIRNLQPSFTFFAYQNFSLSTSNHPVHTSEENNDNMSRSARQSASWWCFSFTHCMPFTAKSPTYSLRKKSLYKSKEKMQQKNIFELLRYTKWAQTINMV